MADGFISFFSNKLHHHDITVIVKDYLCVNQLLDYTRHLLFKYFLLYGFIF